MRFVLLLAVLTALLYVSVYVCVDHIIHLYGLVEQNAMSIMELNEVMARREGQ